MIRICSAGVLALLLCVMAGCSFSSGILPAWSTAPTDTSDSTSLPEDTLPPAADSLSDAETVSPPDSDEIPPPDSDTEPPVEDTLPPADSDTEPPEESDTAEVSLPEVSDTEVPDTEPPVEDETVIIPSLIGQPMEIVDTLSLPRTPVEFVYQSYPLPKGTIFAADMIGTYTDTEFFLWPDTVLTLYVSLGTQLENITVPADDKTFYLTFDDGPSPKYTRTVLDILDAYGIKGTFFLVGENVERYPDLVKEIYDRGHAIGCHSYTHEYKYIYADPENLRAEIRQWEAVIEKALGFVPEERLFRFPGGSSTAKRPDIEKMLAEEGFRSFDWNAVNNDCMQHTRPANMTVEEYMKDSVISTVAYSLRMKTSPHIMLMHDTYSQTAEYLPWLIDYLTELGCTFGTLDELPGSWLH